MEQRTHNKSGLVGLSLLQHGEAILEEWLQVLNDRILNGTQEDNLVIGSPCFLLSNQKGTLVIQSKHVCFGYQLVAYRKFGRDRLYQVTASKRAEDMLISHLCGTRNCCNPDHLFLESKSVNDERTHCHFVMNCTLRSGGMQALQRLNELPFCPHTPVCGRIHRL